MICCSPTANALPLSFHVCIYRVVLCNVLSCREARVVSLAAVGFGSIPSAVTPLETIHFDPTLLLLPWNIRPNSTAIND
jgi:hypothetical protein